MPCNSAPVSAACGDATDGVPFVCADARLCDAADKEGLIVM